MKFGKLADISQVDFTLPPDPPSNLEHLKKLAATVAEGKLQLYTGCTGWSMPEWVGKWYPKQTKTKEFLAAYGKQFNTIEMNTTHYRIPDQGLVEKWCNSVTEDFRFCPKIPQKISHDKNLGLGGDQLPLFWSALRFFGNKLGACFMQLPPQFPVERMPELAQFLSVWPTTYPLAIELRHESWFEDQTDLLALTNLLQKHKVGFVMTDVAGRRDVLHLRLTADFTMIRFVGNGLHPTDHSRIDAWCDRLDSWCKAGLRKVYFFPHEPDNILAPDLTQYFVAQMKARENVQTRGPEPIQHKRQAGEQISLF
jgi:uncharacterized protein YecE (DUF72 family)